VLARCCSGIAARFLLRGRMGQRIDSDLGAVALGSLFFDIFNECKSLDGESSGSPHASGDGPILRA